MKTSIKAPVLLLIITAIISVALYYESSLKAINLNVANNSNTLQKSVNIIVNNMELVINNEQGLHKAKLNALRLQHQAEKSVTILASPSLVVNQPNAKWNIKAQAGSIIHNPDKVKQIDRIILTDNVVITRNESASSSLPFMTLETNAITYYPKEDMMRTTEKVTITSKDSITTADGLEFHKSDQKLKLLNNVKTVYKSNKTSNLALKRLARK